MHPDPSDGELAFIERAETLAEAWRSRYGVPEDGNWTDEQLGQALADHGFPPLEALPAEPRGLLRRFARERGGPTDGAAMTAPERQAWRRSNAAHLIGHAMLHDGQRCPGCEDW